MFLCANVSLSIYNYRLGWLKIIDYYKFKRVFINLPPLNALVNLFFNNNDFVISLGAPKKAKEPEVIQVITKDMIRKLRFVC